MRVDEESLEMSLEMSQQSELDDLCSRERHQVPPRTGREDSTHSAEWCPLTTRHLVSERQKRPQESQVADVHVRHVTAERRKA